MDIKLKNKNFNLGALILAIYLLAFSLITGLYFFHNRDYLGFNPYFKSNTFKSELVSFWDNVKKFHIDYKDYDKKTVDEKVNIDELNQAQENYNQSLKDNISSIEVQYDQLINEAENQENKDKVQSLTKERDKKIEDIKKQYSKTLEDFKKELAANSDKEYESLKKSLSAESSIKYYIKDSTAQETYTNIEDLGNASIENYIKGKALYSINFPKQNLMPSDYFFYMNDEFISSGMDGYFFILPLESNSFSQIQSNYKYYNILREKTAVEGVLALLALGLGIFILRYLKQNSVESFGYINILKSPYEKLPIDINIFIFLLGLLFILDDRGVYSSLIFGQNSFSNKLTRLTFTAVYILYLTFFIPHIKYLIHNIEELKKQWKKSFCIKISNFLGEQLKSKGLFFVIISFSIIYVLVAGWISIMALVIFRFSKEAVSVFLVMYCVYLFIYIIRKLLYLDKIIKATDSIASGNLNSTIKEKGKGNFYRLAHNINNLQSGIKKSVESQMKSDRLKSELITNVSHDLKTPLTSIINYVNLLKREDLSNEEMQDYISVLDRKAQRLKVLIEDLFEASKMASGSVELNIERVDVAELLNQSLAEFEEKIKNSSLTFKVNIPRSKIYADLDGKKTWRVFENLIGNILKYSQPNTRVYITLEDTPNKIIITMKNISSYEMDFDVEEIFERFKRGDTSRATEGSGLGLAIAKSIVELEGGTLTISIDGDLFKATAEFYK